jgi:hypothetical protein
MTISRSKKHGLPAAITVAGAILCLCFSAEHRLAANEPIVGREGEKEALSLRVNRLREKIRLSGSAFSGESSDTSTKLVQFFKFYNCLRSGWKNC